MRNADPALFFAEHINQRVYLLIYVDDCLIASSHLDGVLWAEKSISDKFAITLLGEPSDLLGLQINRDTSGISVSQQLYVEKLLSTYEMTDWRTVNTPQCGASSTTNDEPLDKDLIQKYPSLVGSLMHLSNSTRPDISQAVNTLARYSKSPTTSAWTAGLRVLQYLAKHPTRGLLYNTSKSDLQGYCDANWAGDVVTRRSTTGFVFVLHGGPVAWQSKLQSTVACSTCEAEYQATGMATREALWLAKLLPDL